MQIRSMKKYLDGAQETVFCNVMYRDENSMMLHFLHVEDPYAGAAEPVEIYYWQGRDYLLFKLFSIHGTPRGYRFEVCRDLTFDGDRAERVDLGLCLMIDPVGVASVTGEDVVNEYDTRGIFGPNDKEIIERAKEQLTKDHSALIAEAEELRQKALAS